MARAAGSTYDVRKVYPYCGYETFEFDVPTLQGADVFDRYRTRVWPRCTRASRSATRRSIASRRPAPSQVEDPRIVAAAEGQGLHRDGSADSALPDPLAGLHRAGRRGVRAGRRARAASTACTSSSRRHQPPGARAPAAALAAGVSGDGADGASARSSPTSSPSSARPTSSWETWTGEFPSRDAVRPDGIPEVRAAAVAGRRAVRVHARSSARRSRSWRRTIRPSSASRRCSTRSSWCRSSVGYVSRNGMRHVAEVIGCTPAEVEDVATYYAMFYKQPVGKYVIQVCRTLSCALKGAERVTEEIAHHLHIKPGRRTRAGTFTLARGRVPRRLRSRAGRDGQRRLARVPEAGRRGEAARDVITGQGRGRARPAACTRVEK